LVATLQAMQARLAPEHDGILSRILTAALCYVQPIIRSCHRYRTRVFAPSQPTAPLGLSDGPGESLPLWGRRTVRYWSEEGFARTELLGLVVARLNEHRCGMVIDTGWTDWDLRVYLHSSTMIQVTTAQEDHGGGRRMILVRLRLRLHGFAKLLLAVGVIAAAGAVALRSSPVAAVAGLSLATVLGAWLRGLFLASPLMAVFDLTANQLRLVRCGPRPGGDEPEGLRRESDDRPAARPAVLRALQQVGGYPTEVGAIAPIPSFVVGALRQEMTEKI
jgi:hypothetical protein